MGGDQGYGIACAIALRALLKHVAEKEGEGAQRLIDEIELATSRQLGTLLRVMDADTQAKAKDATVIMFANLRPGQAGG